MLCLSSPIEDLARVGPISLKKLKKLGIKTVNDLLFHFPYRYDDFSNIKNVGDLKVGETATIQGKIIEIKVSAGQVASTGNVVAIIEY